MDQDRESDVSGFILNGPGEDHPLEVAMQQMFDQENSGENHPPPQRVRTPVDPPAHMAFETNHPSFLPGAPMQQHVGVPSSQQYHQQQQQHPAPPPQFHLPPPPQHPVAPLPPPPPQHPVAPPPPPQPNNNIPPNDLQDTIRYYENHVVLPKELLCIVSGSLPYVAGSEFSENPLRNQLNRRERRHLRPQARDVRNEVKRRRGILKGRGIQMVWYQYMDMKQGTEWLKDRENSVLSPLEVTYFTEELRDMFRTNGIDVAVVAHRPREQPQQDEDELPELIDE